MSDQQVRDRLALLFNRIPRGSKSSLARVCGMKKRDSLRAIARYGAFLFPTVKTRLIVIMDAIDQGNLVPVDSGRVHAGTRVLDWQWRTHG